VRESYTPVRLLRAEAAIGGKPTQPPDEGAEFTLEYRSTAVVYEFAMQKAGLKKDQLT